MSLLLSRSRGTTLLLAATPGGSPESGEVAGYPDRVGAVPGTVVGLRVSTAHRCFRVTAYRRARARGTNLAFLATNTMNGGSASSARRAARTAS